MDFRFSQWEYPLAATQLLVVMLGMGAELRPRDFVRLFKSPRSLTVGLVCQFLVVPLLAVGINAAFRVPPGIAFGLVLVAAMPGGPLSSLFTHLGKGNVALAITLTTITTLLSVVTVPTLLQRFAFDYLPPTFRMPMGYIVQEVGCFIFGPLALGMLIARVTPKAAPTLARWCIRAGLLILAVIVVGSLASGRIEPSAFGWQAPTAIIVFCVVSQQLCMLPFRLLRWPAPDRLAVGVEMTIRDINLALLLKATLLPAATTPSALADGTLFAILYYGGTSLVASVPAVLIHRFVVHRHRPLTDKPPATDLEHPQR